MQMPPSERQVHQRGAAERTLNWEVHTTGNWFQLCHQIIDKLLRSFQALIFYPSWYKIRQLMTSTNEKKIFYLCFFHPSFLQCLSHIKPCAKHRGRKKEQLGIDCPCPWEAQPKGIINRSHKQRSTVTRIWTDGPRRNRLRGGVLTSTPKSLAASTSLRASGEGLVPNHSYSQ